jgi:hypothetical protein
MRPRSDLVFVAWSRNNGRSTEIASALGGDAVCVFPERLGGRRMFLLRYLYSAAVTARELARRRPKSLIATNPPVFPGLMAWAYARIAGVPFALDSHPTSFGAKDHVTSRRLLAVHRWLAKRAAAVMVTTSDWSDLLASWGATGVVVHEAPPPWTVPPLVGDSRGRVLFVGVFGGDEPVECVVRAAALRPDLEVRITGDLRRCPPKLRSVAPPNVTFVGYLGGVEYRQEVAEADVVVALTTEPTSIVRAGYEAVYARRPLVITDWSQGKEVFPRAVATANDPDALAAAFDLALTAPKRDRAELEAARTEQLRRWREQEATLRAALGLDSSNRIDESSDTMAVLS